MAQKQMSLLDHCALTPVLRRKCHCSRSLLSNHSHILIESRIHCCVVDKYNPAFKLCMKNIKASMFTFKQAQPLQIQCCIICLCVCVEPIRKSSTDTCGYTVEGKQCQNTDITAAVLLCLIKAGHWSTHLICLIHLKVLQQDKIKAFTSK